MKKNDAADQIVVQESFPAQESQQPFSKTEARAVPGSLWGWFWMLPESESAEERQ